MEALTPQDPTTPVTSRVQSRVPAGPVATLLGAAAIAGYLYANDPMKGGLYLRCPLHAVTGLWCPGCGMTRAAYKLVHGDVAGSLGTNLFLPVAIVLVAALMWDWWRNSRGSTGRILAKIPTGAWIGLVSAFVVFGVLRNFSAFAALAP